MCPFKLGENVVCIDIWKGDWQNYTLNKTYTIISGDRLCPLIIEDDLNNRVEPNWYQFKSLKKIRKEKLEKLKF